MNKIELIIDAREAKLIQLFQSQNVLITTKNLDIGDIWFCSGEDKVPREAARVPFLIIERKTVGDLLASIRDGRHREQKKRLQSAQEKSQSQIFYLIEGFYGGPLEKAVESAIYNTIVRDRLYVYHVPDIKQSCVFLCHLFTKFTEFGPWTTARSAEGHTLVPLIDSGEYIKGLSLKKSTNIKNNQFAIFLCQIPSVGETIAMAIVNKYKTMADLCLAYSNLSADSEKELLLANLTHAKRAVGPSSSAKIYRAICFPP